MTGAGSPTNRDSSPSIETTPNDKPDEVEQSVEDAAAQSDGFGDDFDDFEEGDEDAEFGDFDNAGFQEAETAPVEAPVHSLPQVLPAFVSDPINYHDFHPLSSPRAP